MITRCIICHVFLVSLHLEAFPQPFLDFHDLDTLQDYGPVML